MTKGNFLSKSSLVGLLLTLALLAGCATGTMETYEGPDLPKENIAVIKSAVSGFWGGFTASTTPIITCIDGKEVTGEEIRLLPGRHQIQISLLAQTTSRNFRGNIEFEAHANHEYLANGQVVSVGGVLGIGSSLAPVIWVEDKNTKQIVAQGVPTDQSFKRVQCQSGANNKSMGSPISRPVSSE